MGAPETLRAWRGERTLREAADIIGCDPSYLSLLENRKRVPSDRKLSLKLFKIAGIPPEAWDDEPDVVHETTIVDTLTTVNGPQAESPPPPAARACEVCGAPDDATDEPHEGAA